MKQSDRRLQLVKGIGAIIIAAIYLLNPTAGVLELIPDLVPVIGNLDEAAATALLLYGINELRQKPATVIDAER